MKTTILTIAILTLSLTLISCKDNVMEVQGVSKEETKNPLSSSGRTLIWSHDGMMIKANGESLVERELVSGWPQQFVHDVLITFDGWTDPEETVPPLATYISQLNVYNGNTPLLSESGSSQINRFHAIYANLGGFNPVRFYIALWCPGTDGNICKKGASLKIDNLKIYRID